MSNIIKYIIIGSLIILLAFSDISISYASTSSVSDANTHTKLDTIITWLNRFLTYHFDYYQGNIQSRLDSILYNITGDANNNYSGINSVLNDLKTGQINSASTIGSYIAAQTSSLNQNLYNSLWLDSDININFYDSLGGNVITPSINTRINSPIYIKVDTLSGINSNLFKLVIPVQSYAARNYNNNSAFSIDFKYNYRPYASFSMDYDLSKTVTYSAIELTFKVPAYTGFYIVINPIEDLCIYSNNLKVQYMNIDSLGYSLQKIDYDLKPVYNLQKLIDLYASDDLIDAKENQQQFEDQAINDFTGSGSASSSTSDINSLKGVSNTLKNGINTGGSVNNALSVFSDSNSIWDWFKQDNYNNINNQYNPNSNRLLRSNSGSDDIIDFYHDNQIEVFESLGN